MKKYYLGIFIFPDENNFCSYIRMKPNRKTFRIHTIINGLQLKDLSDVIKNIITKIKLVENKKFMDAKEYVKIHVQAEANTTCIDKTSGMEVSNMIVTF